MSEAYDSRGLHPVGDAGDDTRWMTYGELGEARGINTASAKRLAFRRKWRRQAGNNGTARVAVPVDEVRRRTSGAPNATEDISRLVSGLEAALSTLREQLEHERSRADQADEAAEQGAVRLEEAEARIGKLRAAADTAALVRDSLERALTAEERARKAAANRTARADAEAEVVALRQAEQVRRQLGRVARLRAAWRDGASEGQ
jgi:chromosome segregation ATPase